MTLFDQVTFYTTVNHLKDLPASQAEVVFVGRSNAGKSSLLNTLTRRTRLAFVSKTPGCTQHINFFSLGNEQASVGSYIVDMPGYGYAKAPQAVKKHWVILLGDYLETRQSLIGLVLIMDSRHPLKALDHRMLDFFALRKRPVHIVLSKADKLSRQAQQKTLEEVQKSVLVHYKDLPITAQLFSSLKKQGVTEIQERIEGWFLKTNRGV